MATNLSFLLCFLVVFITQIEASNAAGFTAQLIRRNNSHKITLSGGDFHPPSTYQDGGNASLKSIARGDYLMKISIGTPPVEINGLYDTASDLIWSHCIPCSRCSEAKVRIFDPRYSRSYKNIPCNRKECSLAGTCSPSNNCLYKYFYGDGSMYTSGLLAWETMTFTSANGEIFSKEIIYGCSHNGSSERPIDTIDVGIIGMGGGPLSFLSQMSAIFGGRKFSQCLAPSPDANNAGIVNFGEGSEVTGEEVLTVPLILGQNMTYYLVTLVGVTVEHTFIPYNSSVPIPKGNLLIDSGNPSSWFPRQLYNDIVNEVKKRIQLDPFYNDPYSSLCYESDDNSIEWPVVTLNFEGGNLELSEQVTVIEPHNRVLCFGMGWPSDDISIFGSNLQSDLFIGFDLDKKTVSFQKTDCTKESRLNK